MTFRILVIEDDDDIRRLLRSELEHLEPENCSVVECSAFDEGRSILENCFFDGVVLDLVEGDDPGEANEEKGNQILSDLRARRFIPVVFYTGYPDRIKPIDDRFVKVVSKTKEDVAGVCKVLSSLLSSDLVRTARALDRAMVDILREYYWETLSSNSEAVSDQDIVYSTIRRVTWELSGERAAQMINTAAGGEKIKAGVVFPEQAFMWPPVDPPSGLPFWTGDLVRVKEGDGADTMGIILTPACDLATKISPKNILYAGTLSIEQAHAERGSDEADIRRQKVLQYHYFPAAYNLPEFCLDFARVSYMPYENMGKLKRLATLDEPWVHEVRARFQSYVGRVGTPDYAA